MAFRIPVKYALRSFMTTALHLHSETLPHVGQASKIMNIVYLTICIYVRMWRSIVRVLIQYLDDFLEVESGLSP